MNVVKKVVKIVIDWIKWRKKLRDLKKSDPFLYK